MSAILIKNGTVFDGTGTPPKKTDVLLERSRIARLGDFGRGEAERVLDATGAMVMPGIIETDFEPETETEIFAEEAQRYFLRRGVTTIIDGTDGTSLAPILKPRREGSHDWTTLAGLWRTLKDRRPLVNFGTLIGYAGLRSAFTAGRGRDLDLKEMGQMAAILRQALREGALGIGLGDLEAARLPEWELLTLAQEAAGAKRTLSVHLDDRGGTLGESMAAVLSAAKKSGASIEFTHFEPMASAADAYRSALAAIDKQSARANVNFDVFPLPSARFAAADLLPPWFKSASKEATLADVRAAHAKERLLTHFKKLPLADLRIAEAPRHLSFLKGKRLGDLAADWGMRPERAFLKLLLITDLKCKVFDPNIDRATLAEMVANPRSLLTLSFHEAEGDLREIFTASAAGDRLSEEQAVAKLTNAPAKKFGLARRGLIAPEYSADIVVLRDFKVQTVFINGAEVLHEGLFAAQRDGETVRAGK